MDLPRARSSDPGMQPPGDGGLLACALRPALPTRRLIEPLAAAELHDALDRGRIETLCQPVVRFSDRHPVGLEVLARLDHPTRGTLDPAWFIPPMEQAGLGWKLTEAVISRAFADWGGTRLDALDLTLALNVPLDVLLLPEALSWMEAARTAAGIAARRLVIELTESLPVVRLSELRSAAHRLRGLGYGLAIDDVGPDIRDHSALLNLPFTLLKLDKDVVRDAGSDAAAHDFLAGAIADAAAAGLGVIAEGVEDEATWSHLRALGADFAQGFLVGRPLPAAAVAGWHRDWCARYQS
jgi:EAL domain-containing protein (putative c-di-GMP-specific phosphodiesterase class I)